MQWPSALHLFQHEETEERDGVVLCYRWGVCTAPHSHTLAQRNDHSSLKLPSSMQAGGLDPYATTVMHADPYATTVMHGDASVSDAAGTVVMHKEEEQYGTVVVSGTVADEDPYKEALRMAQEQYASREPSPMGASVLARSDMTEASGYMAAVAHASNDAGACPPRPPLPLALP